MFFVGKCWGFICILAFSVAILTVSIYTHIAYLMCITVNSCFPYIHVGICGLHLVAFIYKILYLLYTSTFYFYTNNICFFESFKPYPLKMLVCNVLLFTFQSYSKVAVDHVQEALTKAQRTKQLSADIFKVSINLLDF